VWGVECGALNARNVLLLTLLQLRAARFQKSGSGCWVSGEGVGC